MNDDYQLLSHYGTDYPEWGSAPQRPLIDINMAHKGELLDAVVGPDPVTREPMVYYILRCELCILTHAWPLPSPEVLKQYYTEQFYQIDKTNYVARYEADRIWWETCIHGPILQQCQSILDAMHVGSMEISRAYNFLDIGAGPGIALDVAKNRFGWDTWGVEPNKELCHFLRQRGHTMWERAFEECVDLFQYEYRSRWDILYLYETLEHQQNPEEFLLHCYDAMKPGGVIAVVVPNDYSPIQLQAQQQLHLKPYWLAPPQHLSYFSPKTLQLVLRRAGFSLVDLRGTYPIDQHLLEGRNYIGNDTLGRQLHQQRMQEELASVAAGTWLDTEARYRSQMQSRIGREIVAIGRKMP